MGTSPGVVPGDETNHATAKKSVVFGETKTVRTVETGSQL